METTKMIAKKARAGKTMSVEEVEEMISQKKATIEEKVRRREEGLIIKQKLAELEAMNRLEEILDCDDEDEAWDLAETEEEKELVRKLFPD